MGFCTPASKAAWLEHCSTKQILQEMVCLYNYKTVTITSNMEIINQFSQHLLLVKLQLPAKMFVLCTVHYV